MDNQFNTSASTVASVPVASSPAMPVNQVIQPAQPSVIPVMPTAQPLPPQPVIQPGVVPQPLPKSRRLGLPTVSNTVMLFVAFAILIIGAVILFQKGQQPAAPGSNNLGVVVPEQDLGEEVDLQDAGAVVSEAQTLIINGDVELQGSLSFENNGFSTSLIQGNLTANQTYSLPDASGDICLSANNCAYATAVQLGTVQGQVTGLQTTVSGMDEAIAAAIAASGVSGLNGTSGEITVSATIGNITIGLPDDVTITGVLNADSLETNSITRVTDAGVLQNVSHEDAGNFFTGGTLPVNRGGTGMVTFNQYGVIYGNNTGALGVTVAGTTGECLVGNSGGAPSWTDCDLAAGGAEPGGLAGGDLGGSYPDPTVNKLQGTDLLINVVQAGHMLVYNASNARWDNVSLSGGLTVSETGVVNITDSDICYTNGNCSVGSGIGVGNTVLQGGNSFGGAMTIGTNDNFALNFETNSSTAVTILPSGNVGIGDTNPSFKMTLVNNGYGFLQTNGTVQVSTFVDASVGYFGTRSNHNLSFFTNNGAARMTVTTGGFVGINTVNRLSDEKLVVDANGGTDFVTFRDSSAGADFIIGDTVTGGARSVRLRSVGASTSGFRFSTGSVDDAVVIQGNNGNVGIGTEAPEEKLHVKSTSNTRIKLTSTNGSTERSMRMEYEVPDSSTNRAGKLNLIVDNGISATGTRVSFDFNQNNAGGVTSKAFLELWPNDLILSNAVANAHRVIKVNDHIVNINNTIGATAHPIMYSFGTQTWVSGAGAMNLGSSIGATINGIQAGTNFTVATATGLRVEQAKGAGTHTTNVGLHAVVSGATNNYAAIFEGGNVGIGTTGPSALLHVESSTAPAALIKGTAIGLNTKLTLEGLSQGTGAATSLIFRRGVSTIQDRWTIDVGGGENAVDNGAGSNLTFYRAINGGASAATLTLERSSGNVGIGIADPSALLHVEGGSIYQTGAGGIIKYANSGATQKRAEINTSGGHGFLGLYNGSDTQTILFGANGDSYINAGNFGIGTTLPGVKLDVQGVINVSNATKNHNAGLATEDSTNLINFGINEGNVNRFGGSYTAANQGGLLRVDTRAGTNLFQFRGRAAGVSGDVSALLDIQAGGNVGIGATDPQEKLDVNGNIRQRSGIVTLNNATRYGTAILSVRTGDDANAGIIVRANSGTQSANLQEWQTAGGSALVRINGVGEMEANAKIFANASIRVIPNAASNVALEVQGLASQTADLQRWQTNAGVVLTAIQADGKLAFGPVGSQDTNLYRSAANTLKTDDNLFIQTSSNSANALMLQNSGGSVLLNADTTNQTVSIGVASGGKTINIPTNVVNSANTVTTSTSSTATAYSGQKKLTALSTGRKVAVIGTSSTNGKFMYSDSGSSWTDYAVDIAGWSNGSIDAYVDSGGAERLVAVWKQSGTGGGRTDQDHYLMIGTFSSDRNTLVWDTASNIETNDSVSYADVVAFAEGTGGVAAYVASYTNGSSSQYALYGRAVISSSGTISSVNNLDGLSVITSMGALSSDKGTTIHSWPSIDYDPSTKRLFAAWSGGGTGSGKGIRFRTASYAGAWTWASEVEVDSGNYLLNTDTWLVVRWDGTRAVIGGSLYTGTTINVRQYESSSFSSFTTHALITNATSSDSELYTGSMAVNSLTGDTYWFGIDDSGPNTGLVYRKWTRATTTLGSSNILESGTGFPSSYKVAVNATPISGGIGFVYTTSSGSPYTIKYNSLTLATTGLDTTSKLVVAGNIEANSITINGVAIGGGNAFWQSTGNDVYYNLGRAAIGTSSMAGVLNLLDSSSLQATITIDATAASNRGSGIILKQGGTQRGIIGTRGIIEGNTNGDLGYFAETGFGHYWYSNTATPKMVLNSSGQLGIGTSSQSAMLQVKSGTNKEIQIGETAGYYTNSTYFTDFGSLNGAINFSRSSDGSFRQSIFSYTTSGGGSALGLVSRADIKLLAGESAANMVTIKEGGKMLFGNGTDNGGDIQISKATDIQIRGTYTGGTDGYLAFNNTALDIRTVNAKPIQIWTNNLTNNGIAISTAGAIRFGAYGAGTLVTDASGNITASSDEQLKNIQGNFSRGLSDILNINPILYKWNGLSGMETSGTYAGFSAQDVQLAIPEAVATDSRGFLTLQDRPILAASVNAIKEIHAAGAALEARVSALEAVTGHNPTFASLNVTGAVTIANLTVVNATVTGNLTIAGHIITAGDTPTTEVLGATTGVTVEGNDTAGTITFTAGNGEVETGKLLDVVFHEAFGNGKKPRVQLTPGNDAAAQKAIYVNYGSISNSKFELWTPGDLADGQTYIINYFVVE